MAQSSWNPKQLRPGPLQGLPHLLHRFGVCRIPAVTESILRFHLTIGLTDLNDQSIIAEAPPQQAGIHPEQIRKAFPGAAEISLPCRFIHRAGVQALHRKGDAFCASVQQ